MPTASTATPRTACLSDSQLAAEKIGHPLAFEPEGSPSDEALSWNVLDLGPILPFPSFPWSIDTSGSRHATWSTSATVGTRDKTSDLQFAFFNGVGWESWENIWGIWNGITPRDAEATRRVAAIERGRRAVSHQPGLGTALSHACVTAFMPAGGRWQMKQSGPS